jgi:hypothetical protein
MLHLIRSVVLFATLAITPVLGQNLAKQRDPVTFLVSPNEQVRLSSSALELEKGGISTAHRIRWDLQSRLPFLVVDPGEPTEQRWLILDAYDSWYKVGIALVYKSGRQEPEWWFGRESIMFGQIAKFTASSSLVERKVVYAAENLQSVTIERPWVEGVPGSGIGEYVTLEVDPTRQQTLITELIFSNGYVSFDSPELYELNNRVRKARISSSIPAFKVEIELSDTPTLQRIRLPVPTRALRFEILDVYRGTKYDDTCVNFLLPRSN